MEPRRVLGPPMLKCCSFTRNYPVVGVLSLLQKKEKHTKFNYQYKDWYPRSLTTPHLTLARGEEVKQGIRWYEGADIGVK